MARDPTGGGGERGEPLVLRWEPRADDWYEALRSRLPLVRWAPWFGAALVAAGAVLLVLGAYLAGVFDMVAAIAVLVIPRWQAAVSLRAHPLAARPVTATVAARSLRLATGWEAVTELPWSAVPGWRETRRGFVLRTERGMYVIPARAFRSDAERRTLADLLRRKASIQATG